MPFKFHQTFPAPTHDDYQKEHPSIYFFGTVINSALDWTLIRQWTNYFALLAVLILPDNFSLKEEPFWIGFLILLFATWWLKVVKQLVRIYLLKKTDQNKKSTQQQQQQQHPTFVSLLSPF